MLLFLSVVAVLSVSFAHDVLYEVEEKKAVVVKVFFSDGTEMAYAPYEVYSPSDPKIPWQKGRTDRKGYLSFYPSENGVWRVKIAEESGHGTEIELNVSNQEQHTLKKTNTACPFYVKLFSYIGLFLSAMLSLYVSKRLRTRRSQT